MFISSYSEEQTGIGAFQVSEVYQVATHSEYRRAIRTENSVDAVLYHYSHSTRTLLSCYKAR